MNFNNQHLPVILSEAKNLSLDDEVSQIGDAAGVCHSERSEESVSWVSRFFASLRMTGRDLIVKNHHYVIYMQDQVSEDV